MAKGRIKTWLPCVVADGLADGMAGWGTSNTGNASKELLDH